MATSPETLHDRWFRIIGIPVVALIANLVFFYDNNQAQGKPFLTSYIHSIIHAWLLWEVSRLIIIWMRRRYASFADSTRRIEYTFILVTLATILVMGGIVAFYDFTNFWGTPISFKRYVYNIFVALMYAVMVGGIYEGVYFFGKWREAFVEGEALKKSNLQSQLDSLKGQINPHFLFNSLSSLSSLIADDSKRAEKFVDELAAVYRYLLQTNEKELTTLTKELEFIHAYFHLLKTRFCDGIRLEIDVKVDADEYFLPPLTLQILLENAVKHNMLLQHRPLVVKVFTDEENNIVVMNNMQKKSTLVASNKMGLANIIQKYKLLRQPKIVVKETAEYFQVIIPLIKPVEYAESY